MSEPITSVAIVGGGFMGAGIAEAAAVAGISVVVRELPEYLDIARQRMETSMGRAVKRGRLDAAVRDSALARITLTSDLKDVAGSELVIEAVSEDVELKTSIMRALDGILGDQAVIASNTSAIPIAQLAGVVRNPGRVLGLHFFSPVPVMGLVEIVRALDTSDDTVEKGRAFVERLGKHAIETKDRSGFIVNFLLIPYLMAAVRMYEEGFASREDIDDGMRLGAGHPMGPLTLCDFIGLDVLHAVCNSLYEEFKRDEYAPPPVMKRMIAAGRLGKKSSRGFYDYTPPISVVMPTDATLQLLEIGASGVPALVGSRVVRQDSQL
jgi:3-hydroxybutyryl-CoA dehydrogenase